MSDELEIKMIEVPPDQNECILAYQEEWKRVMLDICRGLGIPPEVLNAKREE